MEVPSRRGPGPRSLAMWTISVGPTLPGSHPARTGPAVLGPCLQPFPGPWFQIQLVKTGLLGWANWPFSVICFSKLEKLCCTPGSTCCWWFFSFLKKQKVTPMLTATKSILLACCTSHSNNNVPLYLMSLTVYKALSYAFSFLVHATLLGGREDWRYFSWLQVRRLSLRQ